MAYKVLPAKLYLKAKKWARVKSTNFESLVDLVQKVNTNQVYEHNEAISNIPSDICFRYIPAVKNEGDIFLVICCAFTGRHEVLSESIYESFNSVYKENIRWVLCGSTEEDMLYIKHMAKVTRKVSGVIFKNNPLGRKWQVCVTLAGDLYDAELYAITGSDDILSSKLIDNIINKNKKSQEINPESIYKTPALYCTDEWVIACCSPTDNLTPSIIKCKLNHKGFYVPLGAGRFYTRDCMKLIDFKIFDESLNSTLDDYGYNKLKELGLPIDLYAVNDGILISVKGSWKQMNLVDAITNSSNIFSTEFTFPGYQCFQSSLSDSTIKYLFKNNKFSNQFLWSL